MTEDMRERGAKNTDRELWRESEGDYYADSIHVTEGGGIGMNCGGFVIVKPLRDWHKLGQAALSSAGTSGPSCHVCGKTMTMWGWQCSCGATTGCSAGTSGTEDGNFRQEVEVMRDRFIRGIALDDIGRSASMWLKLMDYYLRGDLLSGKGEATPDKPPVSDNPSGMYCPDCRSVGMLHCSDPEHCGGMKPMSAPDRAEELAREIAKLAENPTLRPKNVGLVEEVAALLRTHMGAEPARLWGWSIDEIKSAMRQFQAKYPGKSPLEVEALPSAPDAEEKA